MKKIILAAFAGLSLLSCNKNEETGVFKVKYEVSGNTVTEVKINAQNTSGIFKDSFTGKRDTTIFVNKGTTLELSAKGGGADLSGIIYVDDQPKAQMIDKDLDQDGKTAIKVTYSLK